MCSIENVFCSLSSKFLEKNSSKEFHFFKSISSFAIIALIHRCISNFHHKSQNINIFRTTYTWVFSHTCFNVYFLCIEFLLPQFQKQFLNISIETLIFKSSPPEVFLGKSILKMHSNCTGEHTCRIVMYIKLQSKFLEIAHSEQVFYCKFVAYFQNALS